MELCEILALYTNISHARKYLKGTNALAYFPPPSVSKQICVIRLAIAHGMISTKAYGTNIRGCSMEY